MGEVISRFIIGGLAVSAFAVFGGLFKPTSFAGLFGAAPSVALASLALAVHKEGSAYAAVESRSMLAGGVALGLCALLVCQLMMRFRVTAIKAMLPAVAAWFLAAFCLWRLFLRQG